MKTILSLTLTACATIALPTTLLLNSTIVPAAAQTRQASLKSYSIRNLTLKAPSHWIDYSRVSSDSITLYNQKMPKRGGGAAPKNMIKLQTSFYEGDWQSVLKPRFEREDSILKTETLTINGKPALRRYNGPNDIGDFENTVTTFIRYSDTEIASISTYYNADNPYAEGFINQIHNSIALRK